MSTPEEKRRIRAAINKRSRQRHPEKYKAYRAKYHREHREEENFKRKLRHAGISVKRCKEDVKAAAAVEIPFQG